MQHPAFFAGVDHGALVQLPEFIRQLRFGGQFLQPGQNLLVHLLRGIIIAQPGRHGHLITGDALRSFIPRQSLRQIGRLRIAQLLKTFEFIQIIPFYHIAVLHMFCSFIISVLYPNFNALPKRSA